MIYLWMAAGIAWLCITAIVLEWAVYKRGWFSPRLLPAAVLVALSAIPIAIALT